MKEKNDLNGTQTDFSVYLKGADLKSCEIPALEERLQQDPSDLAIRLRLLFYYSEHDETSKWLQHQMWMMRNRSHDWITGNQQWPKSFSDSQRLELKSRWLELVERTPADAMLVGRAGQFIAGFDLDTAEQLLLRAVELDPESVWSRHLAHNFIHKAQSEHNPSKKSAQARNAIEYGLEALGKEENEAEKQSLLTELCILALDCRLQEMATSLATDLLELATSLRLPHWLFQAHCFLGEAALVREAFDEAKTELLLAADCGFFTDLSLANALLQLGYEDCVLQFLETCYPVLSKYPSEAPYQAQVAEWIQEIRMGHHPKLEFTETD